MVMKATQTMNGQFGKLFHDGVWMTNITSAQASVEIGKEEIKIAGSRWIGHKQVSLTGSGTMTGYKITNDLAKKIGNVFYARNKSFVTELVMKIDDVDNPKGKVWIRLMGVQFDVIPLLNYEHGSIVTEETPFTFYGFQYLA